jgi:hypothetical protein
LATRYPTGERVLIAAVRLFHRDAISKRDPREREASNEARLGWRGLLIERSSCRSQPASQPTVESAELRTRRR